MQKIEALKKYFGYDSFRNGQEVVIDNILGGRDVLCVMPTSAGKSICYQIPALMQNGITIVISPLISLMKDQVSALVQNGVRAAYLNSALTPTQCATVLDRIAGGTYKIIYVAPERLDSEEFVRVVNKQKVSLVAVDEAHCISQWGQDFRPSYLKIRDFVAALNNRPVVGAFTATATRPVKIDICEKLGLIQPFSITTGFDRPNLFFGVIDAKDKTGELLNLLSARREKSGIIYCLTRAAVEEVCDVLCQKGYNATRYHAGLSAEERNRNQEDFVYDRKPIIVATNAFGMGIDKSNVSYVIHYNMPKNLESYYQEAGRAGRDGEPADCILLYSHSDVQMNKFLIEHSSANDEDSEQNLAARKRNYELLKRMTAYCTTTECLRAFILDYFGELSVDCDNCSNCKNDFTQIDIGNMARTILNCVQESGQRFGITIITRTVYGSKDKNIIDAALNKLPSYGKLHGTKRSFIRFIIDKLIEFDLLCLSEGEYPVLKLTQLSENFLLSEAPLNVKIKKPEQTENSQSDNINQSKVKSAESGVDERLFGLLKTARLEIATELHIPAYVVFHDSTLKEMCRILPQTVEQILEVKGVGAAKASKFGDRFIGIIKEYVRDNADSDIEAPKSHSDKLGLTTTPELNTDEILDSLSKNKDPFSGDDIIGMSTELMDYICLTLKDRNNKSVKIRPERNGQPWSNEEDEQIVNEYKSGTSIAQIASAHKRTYGGIKSRLEKLGILDKN